MDDKSIGDILHDAAVAFLARQELSLGRQSRAHHVIRGRSESDQLVEPDMVGIDASGPRSGLPEKARKDAKALLEAAAGRARRQEDQAEKPQQEGGRFHDMEPDGAFQGRPPGRNNGLHVIDVHAGADIPLPAENWHCIAQLRSVPHPFKAWMT